MLVLAIITILMNYCKGGYRLRFKELEKKYKKNKKGEGKKELLL